MKPPKGTTKTELRKRTYKRPEIRKREQIKAVTEGAAVVTTTPAPAA